MQIYDQENFGYVTCFVYSLYEFFNPAFVVSDEEREAAFLKVKIKEKIVNLNTNKKNHIEVKFKKGDSIKGHIRTVSDESFVLVNSQTNSDITINYSDVQDVKTIHGTKGLKIGLVLAAVGTVITWIILARVYD